MTPKMPFIITIIVVLLISFLLLAIWLIFIFPHQLLQVDSFRGIKVGDACPGFFWIKDALKEKHIAEPANFFLIFINDKITSEIDELGNKQCFGKITANIAAKGGHFWCSGDGKVAKEFGINIVRAKEWKLDGSLIIITDNQGKILALYQNAKITDLANILNKLPF